MVFNTMDSKTNKKSSLKIDPSSISSMVALKEFSRISQSECSDIFTITDLSISEDGHEMLASANEDVIIVFNMQDGQEVRHFDSKKYGVGFVQHLSNNECVYSSVLIDHGIRHLSLTDNKFLRYYHGHTDMVTGLYKNPQNETFMSSSYDNTVRFWDHLSGHCTGFLLNKSPPLVAYDPNGIIFAVATGSQVIKLFDVRSFDCGPFSRWEYPKEENEEWIRIEFVSSGDFLVISTNGLTTKVIDTKKGNLVQTFVSHRNDEGIPLRAAITPDAKHVLVGSTDKQIYGYTIGKHSSTPSFVMKTPHVETPQILLFNPKLFELVSVCKKLVLWSPTAQES